MAGSREQASAVCRAGAAGARAAAAVADLPVAGQENWAGIARASAGMAGALAGQTTAEAAIAAAADLEAASYMLVSVDDHDWPAARRSCLSAYQALVAALEQQTA